MSKSNVDRYKDYVKKYELLGKRVPFKFRINEETDSVSIRNYIIDEDSDDRSKKITVEIPSFVTNIHKENWRFGLDRFDRSVFTYVNASLKVINHSQIKDMSYMFTRYKGEELDLSEFDTSEVTNMCYMFSGCENLERINLSGIDTGNVKNMCEMFGRCNSLESIDVSGFNTSKVTDMSSMFKECYSLKDIHINGIDTSNVVEMTEMFMECESLEKIDISSFNTDRLTDIQNMFDGCESLTELDMGNFSNVANMSELLCGCKNLKRVYGGEQIQKEFERRFNESRFFLRDRHNKF